MTPFDLNRALELVQGVQDATTQEGYAQADYASALTARNLAQSELDGRTATLGSAKQQTTVAVKAACDYLGQFGIITAGSTSTGGTAGGEPPAE